MKSKDCVNTRHLILRALCGQTLEAEIQKEEDPLKKAYLDHIRTHMRADEPHFSTVWAIEKKKTCESVGYLRFLKEESKADRAELELLLLHPENSERFAAEALKAAIGRLFFSARKIRYIDAWLNRSLPEVRVLEKAGFERVFEENGLVRYEREKKYVSFLALFMILGTVSGIVSGFIWGNYPVAVAIGVAAGILPGALLDALIARRKRKKKEAE